jgi:hypothetical protein
MQPGYRSSTLPALPLFFTQPSHILGCFFHDALMLKVIPQRFGLVSQLTVPELRGPCWAAPLLAQGLLYVQGHHRLF